MNLQDIHQLYKECHTPLHVQKHMEMVAKIATHMAKKIHENGHKIDVKKVRDLALIHDLMKAITFKNITPKTFIKNPTKQDLQMWEKWKKKYNGSDIEATSNILKAKKEIYLSEAVMSQQFDAITSKKYPLKTLEEKIVYYADKRVAHTEFVSLKIRLQEGYKRYNGNKKKSQKTKNVELAIHMLEEELFSMAGEKI